MFYDQLNRDCFDIYLRYIWNCIEISRVALGANHSTVLLELYDLIPISFAIYHRA